MSTKSITKNKHYKFFILGGILVATILVLLISTQVQSTSQSNNVIEMEPVDDQATETKPDNGQDLIRYDGERIHLIHPEFDSSENVKSLPQTNLDKDTTEIPFLEYPVDSFTNVVEVEDSQKFSIRFTPRFSGDVSSILLPITMEPEDRIKIGIYEDQFAFPGDVSLGSGDAYISQISMPSTPVVAVNFTQNVPIDEQTTYHIVIEPIKTSEKPTNVRIYRGDWKINSLNHTDPDVPWMDSSINTLFHNGQFWLDTENWPIYVINYSDGRSDGQPYTLFAPWIIEKDRHVGQAVIPYSDYIIDEISFVVGTKGDPMDDLYYAIYDSEDNLLRDGLFAKKEEVNRVRGWLSKTLSSPVTFESGELYRIVLYSPKATLQDGFYVYGHEFMLDKTLGYGSTIHHLTASFNGLESWIEWYDADAAFKFHIKSD